MNDAPPNDMVLIDDPQTEESAKSERQTEKNESIINKAIGGLAGPGEELAQFMMGTVIEEHDMIDRYSDPTIYPMWGSIRLSALEAMPEKMDLWEEYKSIRKGGEKEATDFYRKNRVEMDKGAVAAWSENFTKRKEISAIQHEMNFWCDNEPAFWSERQGKPMKSDSAAVVVQAKEIMKRLNGLERGTIPPDAQRLTAFIDVHDDLLYWCVCAWSDDFTGHIVDYGVYPEQSASRKHFAKNDKSLNTLAKKYPGVKGDAAILSGLAETIKHLLNREAGDGC